jgi:hypothetical protein
VSPRSTDPTVDTPAVDAPAVGAQADTGTAPPPAAGGAATQWTMPNLVGSVLQDAQDQMQSLTGNPVFITVSHDLSGADRNQVLDANWQVCTQNVAAGAPLTADAQVDFGVVKLDENCP